MNVPHSVVLTEHAILGSLALIRGAVTVNTLGESWGASLPIAPNDTAAHRAMNRRVALLLR